jgi:cysteine-rich repeat protein
MTLERSTETELQLRNSMNASPTLAMFAAIALLHALAYPTPAAPPPYPVLLVHGLTGSAARTWSEALEFLETQSGWGTATIVAANDVSTDAGHLYALNFSDSDARFPSQNLTFAEQGGELATVVANILAANPDRARVILVAHSMGGVAARNYLEGLSVIGAGQSVPVLLDTDSDRVVPVVSQDLANVAGTESLTLVSVTLDYSPLNATGAVGHMEEGRDPRFFDEVLAFVDALSTCGNGEAEGSETCDDSNTAQADGCSPVCQVEHCGDPDGNGESPQVRVATASTPNVVTASDALFVLQAAVGGPACANCVCDVNASGTVTASDALAVLQSAVRTPDLLACMPC